LPRHRRGFTTHPRAQAHVSNPLKLLSPEGKEKPSSVGDNPGSGATEEVRGIQVLNLVGLEVDTLSASWGEPLGTTAGKPGGPLGTSGIQALRGLQASPDLLLRTASARFHF